MFSLIVGCYFVSNIIKKLRYYLAIPIEEYKDSIRNFVNKKTYEDLRHQGLLSMTRKTKINHSHVYLIYSYFSVEVWVEVLMLSVNLIVICGNAVFLFLYGVKAMFRQRRTFLYSL